MQRTAQKKQSTKQSVAKVASKRQIMTKKTTKVAAKKVTTVSKRAFSGTDELASAKKTALYDDHVAAGGKIVPFCGYALPVQYSDQQLSQSHHHVRTKAGLFDVSHMGQVTFTGAKRVQFIEKLIVADVDGLKPNLAKLTMLTNDKGGVIDDCMITKRENDLYMVLNAGCKDKDMAHIKKNLAVFNAENSEDPVVMTYHDNRSLVALQGPQAVKVMQNLLPEVDFVQFPFMGSMSTVLKKTKNNKQINIHMTRCGYTGEDGFEIGCADSDASELWATLLDNDVVKPAGLGVRDSLRLEAGLCLYGHELNEDVSPIEAGLAWAISPKRKREGGFIGSDIILPQLTAGVSKKLMGIDIKAGAPARQGSTLHNKDGVQVGEVTSGGPAPSLNMAKIAIAFVNTDYAAPGTELQVNVRGKMSPAEVRPMPFVPTNYYRIPKAQ
jgi:aminomethyltransferase